MVKVITVTQQQMKNMSAYKKNNEYLSSKGREEAVRKNKSILKDYHKDIQDTMREVA